MNYNDIIVTSRIRLARNVSDYAFVQNLSKDKASQIINLVFNACDSIGNFTNYRLDSLKSDVLTEFKEDHLISQKLIDNVNISAVCVSSDGAVSVMVNEEDHLREQCTLSGLSLKRAYDILSEIDAELGFNIKFSYDKSLGYLTACPTNLGSGMRVSVMLFLPALTMTGNMEQVINTVSKLGISVRGTFGEGSVEKGYLFQISNQHTLGKTEEDILQNVESTVLKICELEQKAREQLLEFGGVALKDEILRAFGALSHAYSMTSNEAIKLLSKVKLGISLNVIKLKNPEIINDLLGSVSPVKINKVSNKNLNQQERDEFRAQYLSRVLKNTRIG